MFNFNTVNTAEVNAGSSTPIAPVLSILPSEDSNALSWNSPYSTDFFRLYWSADPFTSIDEPDVHEISTGMPSPQADIVTLVTYTHNIPSAFSLRVIYYRVLAFNRNGGTLSNEVNNYNFKLAIYEDIYDKTLEDLTLRFTPEIRKQYEDSQLWRSFVQSLCSELAQSRFSIKEALKQLNLQKAVEVFLSMWRDVVGISKENVIDITTGEKIPETDEQYRQRLVDNVFWDKISNLALKKTMLLKIGYESDVLDSGINADIFRNVPSRTTRNYTAPYGNVFIPGEIVYWLRSGPNSYCTCVSDTGSATVTPGTLTYSNYQIEGPLSYPVYSYFGATSWMSANPLGEPAQPPIGDGGSLIHDVITNPFGPSVNPFVLDDALTFAPSGATGVFKSDVGGVITFELTPGSVVPQQYDVVSNGGLTRIVLTAVPVKQTAVGTQINAKLLSNIYSVSLGISTLSDADLNDIYDKISKYGSIGNVLTKIIQDVALSFNDWDTNFGSIPYGSIFFAAPSYGGATKTTVGDNWAVSEELYMDNQLTLGDGKLFYGNDGPDDIAILTRTV